METNKSLKLKLRLKLNKQNNNKNTNTTPPKHTSSETLVFVKKLHSIDEWQVLACADDLSLFHGHNASMHDVRAVFIRFT